MNKEEIQRVFISNFDLSVINITDTSRGVDQEVSIIETSKGKFVLKVPLREKDKIVKQELAIKLCTREGIPVPRILLPDKNFLVESYLDGKDLDEVILSKKDFEQIYFDLGKILRKIHSIKGENFGDINSDSLSGKFKVQRNSIESWFKRELAILENLQYFSEIEISKINKKYEENKHFLRTKKSVMLHSDFADYNIRIDNKKVSGIMDFADLSVGPPMQDFARMYIDHSEDYKFQSLLGGYGKHNLKEIQFYAFCWAVWKINSRIRDKKFTKKFYRLKKILFE